MALGPQNLFLIKQGAKKNHPTLSAIICFFCDVILTAGSIAGLHELLLLNPTLHLWMLWLGSIFLLYYATKALISAFSIKKDSNVEVPQAHSRKQIILFALGFSLLNPHAIIDTVVIIGSGSTQYPNHELTFLMGVITSSLLWFSTLTFTTHYFSNFLTKARVWQTIEFFSGLLMGTIGIKLVLEGM